MCVVMDVVQFVVVAFASSAIFCSNEATALLQLQSAAKRDGSQVSLVMRGCRHPPPRDLPPVTSPIQDVIVVLGGPTNGMQPGPWLSWRLHAALKVYQQHSPETTAFLLTGGRPKSYGSCAAYTEAAVMQKWLERAGVSKGAFREDRSNHTLDNAELTWHRLRDLGKTGVLASNVSLHIITQPWHMVKARECFRVFFSAAQFHVNYNSAGDLSDDSMTRFEQESYADMYRVQLKNWLPWQLGFNKAAPGIRPEVIDLIDVYVRSQVEGGMSNAFLAEGTAAAQRSTAATQPSSSWDTINDLQWHMFKETLEQAPKTGGLVEQNAFSRWASLDNGHQPRYVTAFNPNRDSGDLLGLSCAADCGRRYAALRVTVFLQQPRTAGAQLRALEDAEAWAAHSQHYSLTDVALFLLRNRTTEEKHDQWPGIDLTSRLRRWNETAFSKMLDTAGLQKLQTT